MRAFAYLTVSALLATGLVVRGTLQTSNRAEAQVDPQTPRSATFAIDCSAIPRPISPLIYGVGGNDKAWPAGVTARRHGGNPATRYNWELDTYNAANDWFFKNAGGAAPGNAFEPFLEENRKRGVKSALTVPILGWVAKDASSYSFPVKLFGPQKATASDQPDAGNGVGRDGTPIPPGPPTITSVRSTPQSIERWIKRILENDKVRGARGVDSYILDNEPMLWNATHRDVHPEPATYDELLEKTTAYASMIRRTDPEAKIAGPAEWGWQAYFYSAKDMVAGKYLRPDRRQHGDVPLIPWYLRALRDHEQKTGTKLLDILDVHYYPMADGVYSGATDPATNARRIRSTRSLWDPTYTDESWINERMRVLPQLREWIAENYPGLGLSIGEWNFGAGNHMSGGLATAEVLGRFGTNGVTSAYVWGGPDENTPQFWAFRAYRNYDGEGGHFLDWSLPVKAQETPLKAPGTPVKAPGTVKAQATPVKAQATLVSLFASRDSRQRQLVAVLLNFAPLSKLTTHIALQGCGPVVTSRGFTYTGGPLGFSSLDVASTGDALDVAVAPYSINVLEVRHVR